LGEVTVAVEGRHFRLLSVDGRPQPNIPFADFLEPLEAPGRRTPTLGHLPFVSLESVPVDAWGPGTAAATWASPWVDWTRFPRWEAFDHHAADRGRKAFDAARQRRKLERLRGAVRFEPEARDASLLDVCLGWKSRQYRRTGVVDAFSSTRMVGFFRSLFDEGLLVVSALFGGDHPVAIHLGCRWEGRFYYWIPAYDESAASCSPGGLLLAALLEESHRRGDHEFDFLIGDEEYKFRYATDVRLVRPLGRPPLGTRAWKSVRGLIMPVVRRFDTPYRALQALKRRTQERRLR
jgi:CelD/BcsL family acetyltransferase involved in cellulose biosynthesis